MVHSVRTLTGCYVIWGDVCQSFQATSEKFDQFLYQRISVVVQRFNALYIFIHQNGSSQKENTNKQKAV